MAHDAVGLAAVNALFLVAGAGITASFGWWKGRQGLVRSLGLSFLVGVAAYGVVAQLLYVTGASMSTLEVLVVCLVPGAGIVLGLRTGGAPERLPRAERALLAGIALLVALLAVDLWFQPLWAFDSWTFWTPKAQGLYALNGLDTHWFTSVDMLGGARRDYPLLLPAVEAAGFRFSGYETSLLDLQSLMFLVAFLCAVWEAAAARSRGIVLAAVLVMLVAAPSTASQLAAAEADIPLAAFFGAAGICALRWLELRRPAPLALAAILAAGAAATKIEGAFFAGALFAALVLVTWRKSRSAAGWAALAGVAVGAAGVAPWRVWVAIHAARPTGQAPSLGASFLFDHLGRVPYTAAYLLDKLLDPRGWLLVLPLWAVALWAAWRSSRRDVAVFALLAVLLGLGGLVVTYWATPLDLHVHLARSARRVVTSLVFFAAALTPLLGNPAAAELDLTSNHDLR